MTYNERKKFVVVLFCVAFFAVGYALLGMKAKVGNAIVFKGLDPEQEALIMTSALLVVLGLFVLLRNKS